jgi:hypothetical protein
MKNKKDGKILTKIDYISYSVLAPNEKYEQKYWVDNKIIFNPKFKSTCS